MKFLLAALILVFVAFAGIAAPSNAATKPIHVAQAKIDPSKLLVRPKSAPPTFWSDPTGWINLKQREFTRSMQKTLRGIRGENRFAAAWTLMLLSFGYGIFHAAGPGHGKTVISAWLLANEHQLRRGILVAFMAAIVQALTAIVLVSVLLLAVKSVGSSARSIAGSLEAASYALITVLGLYLIWQAMRPVLVAAPAGHGHVHHDHDHGPDCDCGHAHMPSASDLNGAWSLKRAFAIAFAVGIRPCSGAILALLASSAIGIYWAGIASTVVMAVGTAITVSLIACIAVSSRNLAMKLAGNSSAWLERTAFALKFFGGLFIAAVGGLLFWATLTGSASII
ncbi:MAG: nickel/cobalt transporter [Rhizobiales bacterium]|nr:nickel/cobalt transporter [Hyphomicrobiales bacterium]